MAFSYRLLDEWMELHVVDDFADYVDRLRAELDECGPPSLTTEPTASNAPLSAPSNLNPVSLSRLTTRANACVTRAYHQLHTDATRSADMVNKNPSKVDDDAVPETVEPVDRESYDNLLAGVYTTDEEGVWKLEIRDWANRVVEATVYEKGRDAEEEDGGVTFAPLNTPETMDDEAYLKELLSQRVESLEEEAQAAGAK